MHMPSLTSFFVAPPISMPSQRNDAHDIAAAVIRYAKQIGCTESNTTAAVAWALKEPGSNTLAAVRAGKQRACTLLARQPKPPTAPTVA